MEPIGRTRKINKLISYLEKGKSIVGSGELDEENGRKVGLTASVYRVGKEYVVEIETYYLEGYDGVDRSNEIKKFESLERAIEYIEVSTPIKFQELKR